MVNNESSVLKKASLKKDELTQRIIFLQKEEEMLRNRRDGLSRKLEDFRKEDNFSFHKLREKSDDVLYLSKNQAIPGGVSREHYEKTLYNNLRMGFSKGSVYDSFLELGRMDNGTSAYELLGFLEYDLSSNIQVGNFWTKAIYSDISNKIVMRTATKEDLERFRLEFEKCGEED